MLIFFIFSITIILLLALLSMIWPPDSPWSPWWRTNARIARIMCDLAKINDKDIIYDLGSGDAQALLTASKIGARGVGIEIDPLRVLISKIVTFVYKLDLPLIANDEKNEVYVYEIPNK